MNQWNPNDYQQHSSQQQKWAKEILPRLHLKGDERILDIGCGDGKITVEVARHVPNGLVIGLDASAEMVDFARKDFSAEEIENLRFQQGDARSLNFHEEFDWVRVKQYTVNPKACVYFFDKRFFRGVMLTGTMEVLTDSRSKKMIWRDGDELYYSKGVTDPDYCVLKFTTKNGRFYSNFKSEDFEV